MSVAALQARELYRFFHAGEEEVLALRGVSVTVEPGEFVAVVGPSGSGKSTLLACLAGLDDPDGGTVHVAGVRMSRRGERARVAARAELLGVLLQSHNLVQHLTVAQNLRLAASVVPAARRVDPQTMLEALQLRDRGDAYPPELSGGEAARAGLAVALVTAPPVLLADEPTGELDSVAEREVTALLRAQAARGLAVLAVTHSPAVAAAADRVVTLRDGRVV